MKNKWIGPFVALLMTLTACITTPDAQTQVPPLSTKTPFLSPVPTSYIGDGGVVSGQPCAAPCFLEIRIGETRLDQVISTLENNGVFNCKQDVEPKVICGNSILVGVTKSTAIVDSIGYYPDDLVKIDEILQKYGPPDVVHVIPTGIPEASTTSVLLFFDKLKMRIRLPEAKGANYDISVSSEIELINYFDDILYSEISENIFSQPWKGYDVYQPDLKQ